MTLRPLHVVRVDELAADSTVSGVDRPEPRLRPERSLGLRLMLRPKRVVFSKSLKTCHSAAGTTNDNRRQGVYARAGIYNVRFRASLPLTLFPQQMYH